MKSAIRAGLCLILAAAALIMAVVTLRSIAEAPRQASGDYVLREAGGSVAVYDSANPEAPLWVTDIAPDDLRSLDREKLRQGLFAGNREELLALLEDLSG